MSRATAEAPVTLPASSRTGDNVTETILDGPVLADPPGLEVIDPLAPPRAGSRMSEQLRGLRRVGEHGDVLPDRLGAAVSVHPRGARIPAGDDPSRVLVMMASSEESTMAASVCGRPRLLREPFGPPDPPGQGEAHHRDASVPSRYTSWWRVAKICGATRPARGSGPPRIRRRRRRNARGARHRRQARPGGDQPGMIRCGPADGIQDGQGGRRDHGDGDGPYPEPVEQLDRPISERLPGRAPRRPARGSHSEPNAPNSS